jgi:hypothetical protein
MQVDVRRRPLFGLAARSGPPLATKEALRPAAFDGARRGQTLNNSRALDAAAAVAAASFLLLVVGERLQGSSGVHNGASAAAGRSRSIGAIQRRDNMSRRPPASPMRPPQGSQMIVHATNERVWRPPARRIDLLSLSWSAGRLRARPLACRYATMNPTRAGALPAALAAAAANRAPSSAGHNRPAGSGQDFHLRRRSWRTKGRSVAAAARWRLAELSAGTHDDDDSLTRPGARCGRRAQSAGPRALRGPT